jgi:hypothetical protein
MAGAGAGVADDDVRCHPYADIRQPGAARREGFQSVDGAPCGVPGQLRGGAAVTDDGGGGAEAVFSPVLGRAAAVPRLLETDRRGELTSAHVRLVAISLGRSERTVWRWLAAAREDGRTARREGARFTVAAEVRRLLALYGGNASRVHAELAGRAAKDPTMAPVPSLSTLHRAIRRDLSRGERAGLKHGEAARRAHDVFGKRPPTHRGAVWAGAGNAAKGRRRPHGPSNGARGGPAPVQDQDRIRTGTVTVPHSHIEVLDDGHGGTIEIRLGVRLSNTKTRRTKLTPDRPATLAEPGLDWA